MPIFDYVCSSCSERFEQLVNAETVVRCPACEATDVKKQLSAFAIGAARPSAPAASPGAGGCGSCGDPRGPGACALN